jgi:hypothetical protein
MHTLIPKNTDRLIAVKLLNEVIAEKGQLFIFAKNGYVKVWSDEMVNNNYITQNLVDANSIMVKNYQVTIQRKNKVKAKSFSMILDGQHCVIGAQTIRVLRILKQLSVNRNGEEIPQLVIAIQKPQLEVDKLRVASRLVDALNKGFVTKIEQKPFKPKWLLTEKGHKFVDKYGEEALQYIQR